MAERHEGEHDRPPSSRIVLAHVPVMRLGPLTINPALRQIVHAEGRDEIVEPKVMEVLVVLLMAGGRILTREELCEAAWDGRIVGDDAINRVLARVRRLSEGIGAGLFHVETVTKVGYRLLTDTPIDSDGRPPSAPDHPTMDVAPAPREAVANAPFAIDRRWLIGGGAALAVVVGYEGWHILGDPHRRAAADSVAVLPFANLSGDPTQVYLSNGIAEELRSALSRIAELKVAARTSSELLRDADAQTAASKLRVANIVTGSVRRGEAMIRVSAQLVEGKTGMVRWSDSYDRAAGDALTIESGIAESVANALNIALGHRNETLLGPGATTADRVAYDDYLRARALVDINGGKTEWQSALALFNAAIAADPTYAAAYAGRARTLVALANAFLPASQIPAAHGDALRAARRAVALAPDLPEVQSTLGQVLFMANLDPAGAAAPFARSVKLAPGDADILIRYGVFATRSGLAPARGIAALRTAVALDPLNPRARKSLAIGLYAARRYADAIDVMRRALALSQNMSLAHSVIGDAALALGNLAVAEAEYQAEPLAWGRQTGLAVLAARRGDKAAARAILAQLVRATGDGNLYQQAEILAQLGDRAGAFRALDRAHAVQDVGLTYLPTDPLLDPLRSDPAFARLQAHPTR